MSENESKVSAWQPFTPRGVAAFAKASFDRFQIVRLLVALFASVTVVVFLWLDWVPIASRGLQKLPESARIEKGELVGLASPVLAENRFLSILFETAATDVQGQAGDVQVAFRGNIVEVCVLKAVVGDFSFGCVSRPYGAETALALGPSAMVPWWGAWRGMILAAFGLAVFLALLLSWIGLGLLYTPVVRLVAFLARRNLTWRESWRLAGSCLMPGALLLSLGILAYGFFLIDFVRLVLIFTLHFVVGWLYVIITPLAFEKGPAAPKIGNSRAARNPFAGN